MKLNPVQSSVNALVTLIRVLIKVSESPPLFYKVVALLVMLISLVSVLGEVLAVVLV